MNGFVSFLYRGDLIKLAGVYIPATCSVHVPRRSSSCGVLFRASYSNEREKLNAMKDMSQLAASIEKATGVKVQ